MARWQPLCEREQWQEALNEGSDFSMGEAQMISLARSGMVRWVAAIAAALAATAVQAQTLTLYGAGSLKEAMSEIARTFGDRNGISVKVEFGPSGLLRERIERGEKVDVFASADMGHPLKLQHDGRATHVAMFVRNALCAVARPAVALTSENFLARLLDPAVKVGTSTPKADPAGDYTWEMFRLADAIKPGSYAVLDAKARQIVGGATTNADVGGRDPSVAALADGKVDMMIGYCTSARLRVSQMPGLEVVQIPPDLRVGAEYGLAVLKTAAAQADDLAFFILSPEGQQILAKYGFNPIGLPQGR
jgi:molybdate transport system substrate-binding protein